MSGEFRSVALGVNPEWELLVYTPPVFVRVASTGLTGYGTWKCVQRMEDRLVRPAGEGNLQGHNDTGEFRRTARRATMAGRREILPT